MTWAGFNRFVEVGIGALQALSKVDIVICVGKRSMRLAVVCVLEKDFVDVSAGVLVELAVV